MSTNDTYVRSATLARAALKDMEVNISIDGAMSMEVTVAAELSSVAKITPYLAVEDDLTSYDTNLSGAWTLGGGQLASTQYRAKDAWEGSDTEKSSRLSSMMNAYNSCALSPCGRLPTGVEQIVEKEIVTPVPGSNDTHFIAVVTRWKNIPGEYATPGYVVHSAHSVYRVLIGCKMMITEEFRYDIRNLEGL